MLTISRLKRRSIMYYNDTADEAKQAAMDRQKANGGLAEYYSEGETRIPTWLIVGDRQFIGQATGLTDAALDGGDADTDDARIWLDDGQAPNGAQGREFTDKSVHGFDLTFAAPKSVSLIPRPHRRHRRKSPRRRPHPSRPGRDGLPPRTRWLDPRVQPRHR